MQKSDSIIKVNGLKLLNDPPIDFSRVINNPVCLITGDGSTLPAEVAQFESWNIPHDLYCVNRSMLFFQRQVDHWCAVDYEEGVWFAEHSVSQIQPDKPILKHTIGKFPAAFDVFWEQDIKFENDIQRRVWIGNSGYFAILTAIGMGYERIVLAGMPLDNRPHWYEPDSEYGPHWHGLAFANWIDFKTDRPESNQVRSLGGYTSFILGQATQEWTHGK